MTLWIVGLAVMVAVAIMLLRKGRRWEPSCTLCGATDHQCDQCPDLSAW